MEGSERLKELGWWAGDGEGDDIYYPEASEPLEAAEEWVNSADWGEDLTTHWVHVSAWRTGEDEEDGTLDRCDFRIAVHPEEPECTEGRHEWVEGREYCSGGGVMWTDECGKCGLLRTTDTWAQDPETGEQGLRSITYEEE